MPTSYQTSATPRGGRRREESETPNSSKASHESPQRVSKKVSKSSEGIAPSTHDRPTSPASFVSLRSAPAERSSLPKHPGLQTPSTMSLNSSKSLPYLVEDRPTPAPPPLYSPQIRPVRQIPTASQGRSEGSAPVASQTPGPGPGPPSDTAKPGLPSPVSDVSAKAKPQTQSSSAEGPRALQPSVEEVPDGETSTRTPAKVPSQEPVSSTDMPAQHLPKEAVEKEDSKDVLHKVTSKTSQSPPPATPAMSPPISPRMHYQATAPIDYGPNMSPTIPHFPYPYTPNMAMMPGSGPFYPNQYYNTPFSPPMEQRQPYDLNGGGRLARSASEDDRELLLEKVSNVLPDIHRLLNEYKQTHGQLSAKEMLVQQSERDHEEKLTRLKIELDANKKEYEKVIQSVVSERGKFEREAAALRQQVADLPLLAEEHGRLKIQVAGLQGSQKELEATVDALQRAKEELQSSKDAQEKEFQSSREAHLLQVAELQKQHEENLAAKEKEHQQAQSEQKAILSKTQLDLAGLISKHANLKNELEASRNLQHEHKTQLDAKAKELDETHARHTEAISAIKKAQEEDHGRSLAEAEQQNAKLIEDHSRKEQKWMQELKTVRNEAQAHKDDLEKERKEHQTLKATRKREQDHASELARGIASWKAKHAELQTEHENVDRLLQSWRPVTEAKPKGDTFFIEAFQHLAATITALSADYFQTPPPALPKDILRLIPPEMPDFTDHTASARQLRAFYIQHKIFQVITRRIFQPFLFPLGCRCGGLDAFLQSLSAGIRSKSERREAAWRQITLRTAYTDAPAKKAIHLVAHRTVEEILREIKWFTDEDAWSSLASRVQFVVKSAAELWRFAKLERELVTVSMPGDAGLVHPRREERDGRSPPAGEEMERTLVLGVIPQIARDAVHTAYSLPQEPPDSGPRVFLHGLALYNDSEIIVTRYREIMELRAASQQRPQAGGEEGSHPVA